MRVMRVPTPCLTVTQPRITTVVLSLSEGVHAPQSHALKCCMVTTTGQEPVPPPIHGSPAKPILKSPPPQMAFGRIPPPHQLAGMPPLDMAGSVDGLTIGEQGELRGRIPVQPLVAAMPSAATPTVSLGTSPPMVGAEMKYPALIACSTSMAPVFASPATPFMRPMVFCTPSTFPSGPLPPRSAADYALTFIPSDSSGRSSCRLGQALGPDLGPVTASRFVSPLATAATAPLLTERQGLLPSNDVQLCLRCTQPTMTLVLTAHTAACTAPGLHKPRSLLTSVAFAPEKPRLHCWLQLRRPQVRFSARPDYILDPGLPTPALAATMTTSTQCGRTTTTFPVLSYIPADTAWALPLSFGNEEDDTAVFVCMAGFSQSPIFERAIAENSWKALTLSLSTSRALPSVDLAPHEGTGHCADVVVAAACASASGTLTVSHADRAASRHPMVAHAGPSAYHGLTGVFGAVSHADIAAYCTKDSLRPPSTTGVPPTPAPVCQSSSQLTTGGPLPPAPDCLRLPSTTGRSPLPAPDRHDNGPLLSDNGPKLSTVATSHSSVSTPTVQLLSPPFLPSPPASKAAIVGGSVPPPGALCNAEHLAAQMQLLQKVRPPVTLDAHTQLRLACCSLVDIQIRPQAPSKAALPFVCDKDTQS